MKELSLHLIYTLLFSILFSIQKETFNNSEIFLAHSNSSKPKNRNKSIFPRVSFRRPHDEIKVVKMA